MRTANSVSAILTVWILAGIGLGSAKAAGAKTISNLPLRFEPGTGQVGDPVAFAARGVGYSLFLTSEGATFSLKDLGAFRMKVLRARRDVVAEGLGLQRGSSNYLTGSDQAKWRIAVPGYSKVRYGGILAGIDLVYYGTNQRELEYDFVVGAGSDPRQIEVTFEGVSVAKIDGASLVLKMGGAEIRQHAPIAYQEAVPSGKRELVAARYVRHDNGSFGFELGPYDHSRPLVIDPTLVYSTYLRSPAYGPYIDEAVAIAVDASGNTYVAGSANSNTFPTTMGASQTAFGGNYDVFVAKLSADGGALVYSTFIGGVGTETATAMGIDENGSAYVLVLDRQDQYSSSFVAKLRPDGSGLSYTTYLSVGDTLTAVAVDQAGNAIVAGYTRGTYGSYYSLGGDAFVTKLGPMGSVLYRSPLTGEGVDIPTAVAVDLDGNAYVAGYTNSRNFPAQQGSFQETLAGSTDAFVAKLKPDGDPLFATYLGGSSQDQATAIAVDAAGYVYVTGDTGSVDFPISPNAFQPVFGGPSEAASDVFVTKLHWIGNALEYSTYLGKQENDQARGIAVDQQGNAHVVGRTQSPNFPTTIGAMQTTFGGIADGFISQLAFNGRSLLYSTLLGSAKEDEARAIALDSGGNVYVTGRTVGPDFPTTPGAYQPDFGEGFTARAYVAKLRVGTATAVPSRISLTKLLSVFSVIALALAGFKRVSRRGEQNPTQPAR